MEYPDKPGVYIMKNNTEVLYIGKAKSLKHRLTAYFQKSTTTRTEDLMSHTTSVDFIVCENEVDALVLEANLIKEYKPKFNIRFKDDTSYPYLKITSEDFPRIVVTRDIQGGRVYGPYGSAKALRKTIKFLRKLFPLRSCSTMKKKECLEFHIGLCPAPCTERVTQEEYNRNVNRMIRFLEGKVDELIDELTREMEEASKTLDFERAALFRDRITALERSWIKQNVNHPFLGDLDVIAVDGVKKKCFTILLVRKGRIVGKHQYVLEADLEDVLTVFYTDRLIPHEIVLPEKVDPVLKEFLKRKKGEKVVVTVPKRGKRKKLLEMAKKDAQIHLKYAYGELELLRDELELSRMPERIEGFDVSNIMGTEATASQVCFVNGKPSRKDYRHYKIKTEGIDDYAMISEVLRRRFTQAEVFPDLILIDGGKGHYSVAKKTLNNLGVAVPMVALAKKKEEVFSERGEVSDLSRNVLIRVRDEAHRFAINYHKKLRQKKLKKSILDEIKGIGEKRKKVLMKHFGSVENVKKASLETLEDVLKNRRAAESVYTFLHRNEL